MKSYILGLAISIAMICGALAQELPLNAGEWNSTIEVLTEAREKIETGWYQVEPIAAHECMATALEKSWSELGKSLVDWDYIKLAMNSALDAPKLSSLVTKDDPLSTPYWGRYYIYWNDAEERTKDDVLAAFDRAIEFAQREERNALEIRATGNQLIDYDIALMDRLGLPMAEKFH